MGADSLSECNFSLSRSAIESRRFVIASSRRLVIDPDLLEIFVCSIPVSLTAKSRFPASIMMNSPQLVGTPSVPAGGL